MSSEVPSRPVPASRTGPGAPAAGRTGPTPPQGGPPRTYSPNWPRTTDHPAAFLSPQTS